MPLRKRLPINHYAKPCTGGLRTTAATILRGPALWVVDDERDHTVGRTCSIQPSSDALLSQAKAGRERS